MTDATTTGSIQRSAFRGALANAGFTLITLPVGVLSTIVVARALGPTPFGFLALLSLLTGAILPLFDFGFQSSFLQWAAAAEARGRHIETAILMRQRLGWVLLTQAVPQLLAGVILLRNQSPWVLGSYVASVSASLFATGASGSLVIQNRTASNATVNAFASVMVSIVAAAAALATHSPAAVWVSRMLPTIVFLPVFFRLTDRRLRAAVYKPSWPRGMPGGYWRFALLSWIAVGTGTLVFSRSEAFVMQLYGQRTALGIFALAYGLSGQLTTPLDVILSPLSPAMAAVAAVDSGRSVIATLRTTRFFALGAGVVMAVVPAVASLVPVVYGGSYRAAASYLLPLAAASTFQTTSNALSLSTYARRDGATLAVAHSAGLVVDGALAFGLIPVIQAWGAVTANAASQLVAIGWLLRQELRLSRIRPLQMISSGRSWACGLGAAGFASVIATVLPSGTATHVSVLLIAGILGYVALVRITGGALEGDDEGALATAFPRARGVIRWSCALVGVRGASQVDTPTTFTSSGGSDPGDGN